MMIRSSLLFIAKLAQVALVAHMLMAPSLAGASTFNVASPAQLSSALATAQVNGEDDTIRIAQGSYCGNFIYSSHEAKSLSIQGGWTANFASRVIQPENTVLDGGKTGTVLVISSDQEINLTIEGITIQNGQVQDQHGGGLYISNFRNEYPTLNTTTIRRCIVRNNLSVNAGAGHDGGGIYLWTSTDVVITQNTISGNSTITQNDDNWYARGGGIFVDTTMHLEITNNLVNGNQAGGGGGGFWANQNCFTCKDDEQVSIRSNTIRDNQANIDGGGLSGLIYGPSMIADNVIVGNHAGSQGGGMQLWPSEFRLTLINNVLAANIAGKAGGGLSVGAHYNGVISMTNNTVVENQAGSHGGGLELVLYEDTTTANLFNNIIWRNDSFNPGRDLYIENDEDENYLGSVCNLYNNDFNQSGWGTYVHIPFPFHASNLNGIDPFFVQPMARDYRLGKGSPCLNSGSNTAPNLPAADIAGKTRIQDQVVDMGAYEGAFDRKNYPVIAPLILLLNR